MKNVIIGLILATLNFGALAYDGLSISDYREGTRYDSANKPYTFVFEWYGVSSNGFPLFQLPISESEKVAKLGTPAQCTLSYALYSSGRYAAANPVLISKPAGMTSQFSEFSGVWKDTHYVFTRNTDCLTAVNELGVTYGFFSSDVRNEQYVDGTNGGNDCLYLSDLRVENVKIMRFGLEGCYGGSRPKPVSCMVDSPTSIDYGIIRNTDLNASRIDNMINISCLDAQNTVLFAVNPNPVEMGSKLSVKPEVCIGTSCEAMKTVTFKGSTSINLRTTLQSDNNNPPEGGVYQAHIILSANYY